MIKLHNPGLGKNFRCYLIFTVKGGFFTRLRFKEKKFAFYNRIGPQFCGKTLLKQEINSN